jgi:hypothetical protein
MPSLNEVTAVSEPNLLSRVGWASLDAEAKEGVAEDCRGSSQRVSDLGLPPGPEPPSTALCPRLIESG